MSVEGTRVMQLEKLLRNRNIVYEVTETNADAMGRLRLASPSSSSYSPKSPRSKHTLPNFMTDPLSEIDYILRLTTLIELSLWKDIRKYDILFLLRKEKLLHILMISSVS